MNPCIHTNRKQQIPRLFFLIYFTKEYLFTDKYPNLSFKDFYNSLKYLLRRCLRKYIGKKYSDVKENFQGLYVLEKGGKNISYELIPTLSFDLTVENDEIKTIRIGYLNNSDEKINVCVA